MKLTIGLSAAFVSTAMARTITVYNACPFTIWPGLFTTPGFPRPNHATGWEAPSFTHQDVIVADNWNGRVWGRRNCNFANNPGPNSCLDGGCNGGLQCDVDSGTGVPPATLAEWNLSGAGGQDFYDVSLVDGYNLPMRLDNNKGCKVGSCPVDLGPGCPADQKGPFDGVGFPVGCRSACEVDARNGQNGDSPNCCTGSHKTPETCPPSGVRNYGYFKNNCPNSYAYAYDESSGTALFTCPSASRPDYTVTFCP